MTSYSGLNGNSYQVSNQPIASGGEGLICPIVSNGHGNLLAKLYKPNIDAQVLSQKYAKLITMAKMNTDSISQNIAWPNDILIENRSTIKGFVMRKMPNTKTMAEVVSQKDFSSWRKRLILAANLCDVVNEVHAIHQVIGDMQPQNFGVDTDKGYCYAFDADSFHIKDASGRYYPCVVGLAEYFAPELQAKIKQGLRITDLDPAETFTQQTDLFALAVLLFQILFKGFHPFTGRVVETADSSVFMSTSQNISRLRSPYFNPPPGMAMPAGAPPTSMLPNSTQVMFHNALLTYDRPSAAQWQQEIIGLIGSLSVCSQGHEFHKGNKACPWCALEQSAADRPVKKKSAPQTTPKPAVQQDTPPARKKQPSPQRQNNSPQRLQQQTPDTPPAAQPRTRPQSNRQQSVKDDRSGGKKFVYFIACLSLWVLWIGGILLLSHTWFTKHIQDFNWSNIPVFTILSIPCFITSFHPPESRGANAFHNLYLVLKNGRYAYYFVMGLLLLLYLEYIIDDKTSSTAHIYMEQLMSSMIIYFAVRAIAYLLIPEKSKQTAIVDKKRGKTNDH